MMVIDIHTESYTPDVYVQIIQANLTDPEEKQWVMIHLQA